VMALMLESKLSPEKFGSRLGISGMTLRRWKTAKRTQMLPKIYQLALIDMIHQLLGEGVLSFRSKVVRKILKSQKDMSGKALVRLLSIPKDCLSGRDQHVIAALVQMGKSTTNRRLVDKGQKALSKIGKQGACWASALAKLRGILASEESSKHQVDLSYGALFYLLSPVDLILRPIEFFSKMHIFGVLNLVIFYVANVERDFSASRVAPEPSKLARMR